jgi:hypothetical protein
MSNDTEYRRSMWESLPAFIALLGAMAAIAYFLGKQYWDSYYSTFGIPASEVRLSPAEYMFASKRFFIFLLILGAIGLFWYTPRRSEGATAEPSGRWTSIMNALEVAGRLLTSPLPEWKLSESWLWTYTVANQILLGVPFLFYAFVLADVLPWWGIFLSFPCFAFLLVVRAGNSLVFVAVTAILLFFGVVAFMSTAPGSLAEGDAGKILDNPGRLPQVEVIWDESVEGVAPIAVDNSGTSRARILTTNPETYFFLVEDQDSTVTVAVPSTAIRAVRYVAKSD